MIILMILLGVIFCLILPGLYSGLKTVRYEVKDKRISHPVRIALVTDLHSCAYGRNQRKLLEALRAEDPDLILLDGDIFDDDLPDGNTMAFLKGLPSGTPCYYVPGNHEHRIGEPGFTQTMEALEACGVIRLDGKMIPAEINGTRLNLCGADDPAAWFDSGRSADHENYDFREQVARLASLAGDGAYTILLSHRPEWFDLYSQYDFDLALAGHAHGGQWRIPGILNGLYAPNQGLFPKYAGGRYEKNGTTMIVSRGLARESAWVPRIYNRPELVMVELKNV